jgi:glutamate racemase
MKSDLVIERALENFDSFQIADSPPENLLLLQKLRHRLQENKPFANIDVLFIQHHLGPLIGRLHSMIECGLDPNRSWFVDIPYSTNTEVVEKLGELGFPLHQRTARFDDPLSNYDFSQAQRVLSLMEAFAKREDPRPVLVIDDGAYFARYLNSMNICSPNLLESYVGTSIVEQTTRGHRYLCNESLEVIMRCNLSVVSIAKCKTKREFEGPFIGAAVSRAMERRIGEKRICNAKHIAVIGCGVVGEATVKEIIRICPDVNIDVVDIDVSAREKVSRLSEHCEGLPQLRDYREYDIVLGCTGYNSFHVDQRKLLADNAVLASGSSAAIEFNRARFIELADRDDNIEIVNRIETISQGIHAPIFLRQENGSIFSFLNAGFPINFDGEIECLPTKIIQATHGLLFMASIQALSQKGPGINTINPDEDKWIFGKVVSELSNSPELR